MAGYDGVHSLALEICLGHRRGERRGRATPWKEVSEESSERMRCIMAMGMICGYERCAM